MMAYSRPASPYSRVVPPAISTTGDTRPGFHHRLPEDIRKLVNQLRTRLRRYGPIPRGFVDLLPKKGAFGLDLDPEHVQFIE